MFFKSLDSIIKQHILLHKGTSENWEAYRALIEFMCLHLGYRGLTEALLCTEYVYSKAVNGVLRIDKRPMHPQGYLGTPYNIHTPYQIDACIMGNSTVAN